MADEEEIVPLHLLAVERRANSDEAFDLDRISDVRVKRIVDHKAKCESDALTEFAIRHAKEHESDLDKTVYDDHVVITEDDTDTGYVHREIKSVIALLGKEAVEALRSDLVVINVQKTLHKQMRIIVHIPDGYPTVPLSLEISSTSCVIPGALCDKMNVMCNKIARANAGSGQLEAVIMPVKTLLYDNMLCACWGELSRFQETCKTSPDNGSVTFKANEKTGEIKCKAKYGEYYAECCAKVPDGYPFEIPTFMINETNVHSSLSSMFLDNIKRACIVAHRSVVATATKGKSFTVTEPSMAAPNLYEALHAFAFTLFFRLVRDCCPLCSQNVLPADPTRQTEVKLELLPCGHVYHYSCLDSFMTKPPFLEKLCLVRNDVDALSLQECKTKVSSSNWPSDVKVLEKRWAAEQLRNRDIADVADFMGVGPRDKTKLKIKR